MKQILKILIILLIGALAFTANAFSEKITLNGTIKGASCVINKTYCAEDNSDPHLALENTFVLVDDTNNYFFLSNLGKIMKMKLINKKIHVEGKKSGQTIYVAAVYDERNNKIWDWAKIQRSMRRN